MLNSATALIHRLHRQPRRLPMESMYYIGLDVHKKTISYCVKDASGRIHVEGKIPATRFDLDRWMKTLPQPWTVAMEATMFTGWIYDYETWPSRASGGFGAHGQLSGRGGGCFA